MANHQTFEMPDFDKDLRAFMKRNTPRTNGGAAPTNLDSPDAGVDNILKAGALSADTFRQAMDEAANRVLQVAEAVTQAATDIETLANHLADECRKRGTEYAFRVKGFADLAANVAEQMSATRRLVDKHQRIEPGETP